MRKSSKKADRTAKALPKKAAKPVAKKVSAPVRPVRSAASRAVKKKPATRTTRAATVSHAGRFDEVVALIETARQRAYQAVNTQLVDLYWQPGAYINQKIESAEWGDGVVDELAATLARRYPGMRGYTRRNLFRMRQFFEAYRANEKVSPLVTQLPWTHHMVILGQAKPAETRDFISFLPSRTDGRSANWNVKSSRAPSFDAPRAPRKCQQR